MNERLQHILDSYNYYNTSPLDIVTFISTIKNGFTSFIFTEFEEDYRNRNNDTFVNNAELLLVNDDNQPTSILSFNGKSTTYLSKLDIAIQKDEEQRMIKDAETLWFGSC